MRTCIFCETGTKEVRMKRLMATLGQQFTESARQEKEIQPNQNLKGLGYEIWGGDGCQAKFLAELIRNYWMN